MTATESSRARTRHAAHRIQTSHKVARVVQDATGLDDIAPAMAALEVVASGIVRRLTPAEANDFISQLPSELHDALFDLPAGPDQNVTLDTIQAELAARLSVELDRARQLMREVGVALRSLVSRGEIDQVLAQLPREMREILPDVIAHPTP